MGYEKAICCPKMRYTETMDGFGTAPVVKVVGVFFTCVVCGKVEEIRVPREEGLPPKAYWECLNCQKRDWDDGAGRKGFK